MPSYDKAAYAEQMKTRTKELTDKLETGMKELYDSDKYKSYLNSMAKLYQYSSNNIMLIHKQMPDATQIASYTLWKEKFSRQVKKGETGLYIYAPAKPKEPEKVMMEKLDPETGAPLLDKNGKVIMEAMTPLSALDGIKFVLVPVFDVSQTVGDPIPELVENIAGNVAHYEAFLDALKDVSPLPIEFEAMPEDKDGYCQYGVKIGIREDMSETQTVSAVIHEMTHDKLHDKNKLPENAEPKKKRIKEIEAESISYVVCQHYGIETSPNSFGYLAEYGSRDMSEIKASLDTIRKEAGSLITAIDERFNAICQKRGIDLTAKEPEKAATTPEQAEPSYSMESRIENIAGVDFSFQEVVPEIAAKPPIGYLYFASSDEKIPYYSDNAIIEAYKKELDSLSVMGVMYQDVTDEALSKKLYEVYAGKFGETPESLSETTTPPRNDNGISFYTLNIDSNSVPSFYDNHIDADVFTNSDRAQNNPLTMVSQNATVSDSPDIIMPDPAISFSERDLYGYTVADMLPLTQYTAAMLFDCGQTVYMLYPDNTEAMAFDTSEIAQHDGIFGVERDEWLKSKEYASLSAQTQSVPAAVGGDIDFKELPETPDIPKSEQPIYPYSAEIALKSGEIDAFHASRNINIECGRAIDQAVKGGDFEAAAKTVIDEYGADRVAWVLAANVNSSFNDGRLSSSNKEWARELDTPKPDIYFNMHKTELDIFINNFREAVTVREQLAPNDIPVYKFTGEIASQNGEIEAYRQSYKINVECGEAIDKAIADSNHDTHRYDLKAAVKSVIEVYGVDRVAWVLAANVNHYDYDGRLSNTNKVWATEHDTPKPDYYLKTHLAILDGFSNRFREAEKEKPSLLDTLNKTEQKIRQQGKNPVAADVDGKEKPKKTNREDI